MAEYIFTTKQTLDLPRDEVFEFFSNAENLERITPPELGFNIITPLPIDIKQGTLIDYKLSLHGFPIKWRTEITHWEPPFEFVDMQFRGPYKQWIHTHRFTEPELGKTLMEDEVVLSSAVRAVWRYRKVSGGRQDRKIFDFRRQAVDEYFRDLAKASAR